MYPTFAFMSHSCNYNAKHVIDAEDKIRVTAQKMIKAGEEICITYTGLLTFSQTKQEKLENIWYFTCSCERCSDPTELGSFTSSVCCPGCPRKGYLLPCITSDQENNEAKETSLEQEPTITTTANETDDDDLDDLLDDLDVNPALFKKPEEPKIEEATEKASNDKEEEEENLSGVVWGCSDCKMTISGDKVCELLQKTSSSMPGPGCNEIAKHEAFLAATINMLHPNNFQSIITKRILSQLYGRGGGGLESLTDAELHRKMSLCRELLQYISLVDSGYSQFRGLTTWELFLAKQCFIRRKYSEEKQVELQEELIDLLKVVHLCLKEENENTGPGRVHRYALKQLAAITDEDTADLANEEITRLYSKISDQNRDKLR